MDQIISHDTASSGSTGPNRVGDPSLGIGTWNWRTADGQLHWSEGVHSLLRHPPDHAVNWECWVKSVHPEDQDLVRRSIETLTQAGEVSSRLIYRLLHTDGSIVWIEDRRTLLAKDLYAGVFIDITQTVAPHKDNQFLGDLGRRVMDAVGTGVFFRDFESDRDYWNNALFDICGLPRSSSPPKCDLLLPVQHLDDVQMLRGKVSACRTSRTPPELEYRILAASGEIRWIRERGFYMQSSDGQLLSYLGLVENITDEKKRILELEESRHFLSLALKANRMGVWEWNRTAGRQTWSDEFCRMLGYEPGKVIPGNDAWISAIHPLDRAWASEYSARDNGSEVSEFTYRALAAGRTRWIRESWRNVVNEDGSRVRLGVSADITDLKEREDRLAVTDQWLRLAASGGKIGLWRFDGIAGTHYWDDKVFELLGYLAGEVEPSEDAWLRRIHPDDVDNLSSWVSDLWAGKSVSPIEFRVVLPETPERWLEQRGMLNEDGVSSHGVLFDITERKTAEQRLRDIGQRLQLALDTGRMGFWTGYRGVEEWDERTYRILGYEPFSVAASRETFLGIVHPDDKTRLVSALECARHSNEILTQQYRITLPDGSVRWIESNVKFADAQQPDRYGVVLDITDRKTREELHLKTQRIETAGSMLRGLAHDFNNFLAVINATLEPLANSIQDPYLASCLLKARQATLAGAIFSRRLINISREREWKPQYLDLGPHLEQLAETVSPVMKYDVELIVDYPPDLWTVNVDSVELDSAIINLLINARDAISSRGTVTITASNRDIGPDEASIALHVGPYVAITVHDNGKGMDANTTKMAMEPFFTTKPEGSGTGLGLSSVTNFAAAAGGYTVIESAIGKGTSVSIYLPRAFKDRAASAQSNDATPTGDGELVLVVEDDPIVREMLMQRVEALGYAVEEASNPESALEALRSIADIAMVLSDVGMPGQLSGLDLRQRVDSDMPHIPVVLITADQQVRTSNVKTLSKLCSQRELGTALADALALRKIHPNPATGALETGTVST